MYPLKEEIHETVIERSRFICYLKRVQNEEGYREYLAQIRKKHYDASHVCSALLCHNIQRSSDDGEPSGTAGAPMLNALKQNDMDETCALVVRYFGGIKLGAGGLIRAYSKAVSDTLKEASLAKDVIYTRYELKLSYEQANRIANYLRSNTILLDTVYDEDVTFIFALDDERKLETIESYTRGQKPLCTGEQTIQKVVE